ncbi:MAG: PTS sugar transporter subunit IIB [Culicoidibacterales bacterium]
MKVLLVCSGGMSTTILVSALQKQAAGTDFTFDAVGTEQYEHEVENFDMVLVAPQVKHRFSYFDEIAQEKGKKITQIAMTEYSPMGAPKLFARIKEL